MRNLPTISQRYGGGFKWQEISQWRGWAVSVTLEKIFEDKELPGSALPRVLEDLDLSAFDLEDMNFRLKKVPRIYSAIYEMGDEPTKRSMDILERKYLKNKVCGVN